MSSSGLSRLDLVRLHRTLSRQGASVISICFSTTASLFSRLIRWVTRSRVSHVALAFRDPIIDRVLVLEVAWSGFVVTPWLKWAEENSLVARYELQISSMNQLQAIQNVTKFLGTKYDFWSLLGFVFTRWKKRYPYPLTSPKKLICSEAVALFLGQCGVPDINDPGCWSPADLLRMMQGRPDKFVFMEGPVVERALQSLTHTS